MKPISWYKSLTRTQTRREEGYFLVDGKRSVNHLLTHHAPHVLELLCIDDTVQSYQSYQSKISLRVISEANMNSIAPSRTPQGICAVVKIPDGVYSSDIPEASKEPPRRFAAPLHGGELKLINAKQNTKILLLEHVQDPGNVGTLIRTAAAFGVSGIIMSDQCADPFSPKVVQSTAGSILSLSIRKTNNYLEMIRGLKDKGYKLIAADLRGDDIQPQSQKLAPPTILALGNEGAGLSDDVINMSDYKVRIPISDSGAESLNVAVAGGILMFMWG